MCQPRAVPNLTAPPTHLGEGFSTHHGCVHHTIPALGDEMHRRRKRQQSTPNKQTKPAVKPTLLANCCFCHSTLFFLSGAPSCCCNCCYPAAATGTKPLKAAAVKAQVTSVSAATLATQMHPSSRSPRALRGAREQASLLSGS